MLNHRNRLAFLSKLSVTTKSSQPQVKVRGAIPPPKPSTLPANHYTYEKVDKDTVKQAEKKIYAARTAELKKLWDEIIKSQHSKTSYVDAKKLNDSAWYPAAKDMNARPAIFHMSQPNPDLDNESSPPPIPREKVSSVYVRTMAAVGKKRGFAVHVQYHDKQALKRKWDDNVTFLQSHHVVDNPWIEDCCAFVPAGMTIPAPILLSGMQTKEDETENDDRAEEIDDEILLKEIDRLYGPKNLTGTIDRKALKAIFPLTTATVLARASLSDNKEEISEVIHRALASQRNIRANLTYIDGGNHFIGILKNGQRYALVGRNSVEFSRALLQKQLQELYPGTNINLSDDIMRYFIAIDLGIPLPNNVAFVEQPAYHLDCAMMLLNGEVLLNDSLEARELELKWNRERGTYFKHNSDAELINSMEKAAQQDYLEERALRDIQEQLPSLPVHRAALCFRNEFGLMNFANGEVGVGVDNKQFAVLNGGTPEAELYIRKLMRTYGVEVEFVPFRESQCSLSDFGGMGCRAKCEERVELLSALPISPRVGGRRSLPIQRHNLFASAAQKDSSAKNSNTTKFMCAI